MRYSRDCGREGGLVAGSSYFRAVCNIECETARGRRLQISRRPEAERFLIVSQIVHLSSVGIFDHVFSECLRGLKNGFALERFIDLHQNARLLL